MASRFGRHLISTCLVIDSTSKCYGRFASRLFHLDIFQSRSGSCHFRAQTHLPKAMADLLIDWFIWTSFCPDPDPVTFEPRHTLQKLWQICFQIASLGHLSVQIRIKPFPSLDTPSQSYPRACRPSEAKRVASMPTERSEVCCKPRPAGAHRKHKDATQLLQTQLPRINYFSRRESVLCTYGISSHACIVSQSEASSSNHVILQHCASARTPGIRGVHFALPDGI